MMILMISVNARTLNDTVYNPVLKEQSFKVAVVQPDGNTIDFRVQNPAAEKVILKIYNEDMVKIFHRTLKDEKEISIRCDLSNCEAGSYTAVVKRNGQEEVRKVINLN